MSTPKKTVAALLLAALLLGGGWAARATHVLKVCPQGCAYARIQDALDALEGEGFVFVRAGTYRENLRIDGKRGLTLIAHPGEAVTLEAGDAGAPGISILNSQGVTVQGLRVLGGARGLEAGDTLELNLLGNQFEDNAVQGVVLSGTRATLDGNLVLGTRRDREGNNGQGIVAFNSVVTIQNSGVLDNAGFGVLATGSSTMLLTDNTMEGNGVLGIGVEAQAQATIQRNLIDAQKPDAEGRFGRGIEVSSSGTVIVMDNFITGNANAGLSAVAGAQLVALRNTISGTDGFGVLLAGTSQTSLAQNTISDNARAGVALGQQAQVSLADNAITGNGGPGVSVGFSDIAGEAVQAELKGNRIQANGGCAVAVDGDEAIAVAGERNRGEAQADTCDPAGKLGQGFWTR